MSAARPVIGPLPVGAMGRRGPGWWGAMTLITSEALLFAYLLFSYYYFDVQLPPEWRARPHLDLTLAAPNTGILLFSSVCVWWGEKGVRDGRRLRSLLGLGSGLLLGVVFIIIQSFEWRQKAHYFTLQSGPYGSFFFTITGFHLAHVIVGAIALAFVLGWTWRGYFDRQRNSPVLFASIYWHFVDAVWVAVFTTFYLTPYFS